MRVWIDRRVIGSPRDVCVDVSTGAVVRDATPSGADWTYAPSCERLAVDRDAAAVVDILALDHPTLSSSSAARYEAMLGTLDATSTTWYAMLPRREYRAFLRTVVDVVTSALSDEPAVAYHDTILSRIKALTSSLETVRVDPRIADEMGVPHDGTDGGRVTYDPFRSRTGRLIPRDGAHFVTMPSRRRERLVRSAYGPDGAIISFDFRAFEPRVGLALAGHTDVGDDAYTWIAERVGVDVPRGVMKRVVPTVMYSGGASTIESFGVPHDVAKRLEEGIWELFACDDVVSRLATYDGERVRSMTGRVYRCPEQRLVYCTLVQSLCADVAAVAFADALDATRARFGSVRPFLVVYDSLYVDVSSSDLEGGFVDEFVEACRVSTIVDGLDLAVGVGICR